MGQGERLKQLIRIGGLLRRQILRCDERGSVNALEQLRQAPQHHRIRINPGDLLIRSIQQQLWADPQRPFTLGGLGQAALSAGLPHGLH